MRGTGATGLASQIIVLVNKSLTTAVGGPVGGVAVASAGNLIFRSHLFNLSEIINEYVMYNSINWENNHVFVKPNLSHCKALYDLYCLKQLCGLPSSPIMSGLTLNG